MKLVLSASAERHLDEGYQWYERQDPGAGDYFLQFVLSELRALPRYAGIHRKVFSHHRLITAVFPFSIYYSIQGDTILVKAILDNRRSPSWIKRQLGD